MKDKLLTFVMTVVSTIVAMLICVQGAVKVVWKPDVTLNDVSFMDDDKVLNIAMAYSDLIAELL